MYIAVIYIKKYTLSRGSCRIHFHSIREIQTVAKFFFSCLAERLPMRVLSRMWQMLLTALEEVGRAPNAMMAAEMALIRLTHVADLPTPDELIRKLQNTPVPTPEPQNAGTPHGAGGGPRQSAPATAPQATNPSAYPDFQG